MAPPSSPASLSAPSSLRLTRRSLFLAASVLSFSVLAGLLLVSFLSPASSSIPFPPFLKPLGARVLYRLRDVCVFLLCTSAIAVFIRTSPKKHEDAPRSSKRTTKAAPFEHLYPPAASLFGDSEFLFLSSSASTPDGSSGRHQRSPAFPSGGEGDERDYGDAEVEAVSSSPVRSERGFEVRSFEDRMDGGVKVVPALHRRNLSKDEGASPSRGMEERPSSSSTPTSERKLHRKSSSLDDRLNYEPAPHAAEKKEEAGKEAPEKPVKQEGEKKKPLRRVSFYIEEASEEKVNASVSSSALTASPVAPLVQNTAATSPNELINRQADAFIAKFKEQIRLQNLESFKRFRRKAAH